MAAKPAVRDDHARARRREPHLPPRREPGRQGALGRVLRPQPDRRPVRHAGSPRAGETRRRCSSPTSTSRRRATRTTSSPASTSCTSSATGAPSSTARWSRSSGRRSLTREERAMAQVEEEPFTFKALHEQDGLKVSESPWGPDDEIGRLNWITPDTNRGDPRAPRRLAPLRPERRVLHRHAVVGRGRRPAVRDLDDAHAAGLDQRQPLRRRPDRARALLVLRRLDPPLHPLRHARRHAQPPRPPRHVLERVDGGQGSRQPHLEQGRPRQVPADHLAGCAARRRRR